MEEKPFTPGCKLIKKNVFTFVIGCNSFSHNKPTEGEVLCWAGGEGGWGEGRGGERREVAQEKEKRTDFKMTSLGGRKQVKLSYHNSNQKGMVGGVVASRNVCSYRKASSLEGSRLESPAP